MNDELVIEDDPLKVLVAEIQAKHQDVLRGLRRTLDDACQIGRLLEDAHTLVPYGQWIAWVDAHCPFSYETSAVYRRVHRRRQELPTHLTTLEEGLEWLTPTSTSEESVRPDLQPATDPQAKRLGFPTEPLTGTVPQQLELIDPPPPAAHTALIADQRLLLVVETIRMYTMSDIAAKRDELLLLRHVVDAALSKVSEQPEMLIQEEPCVS